MAFSNVRIQGTLKLKSTIESEEDKFLSVCIHSEQGDPDSESEYDDLDFVSDYQSYIEPCECPPQETHRKHYWLETKCSIVIFSVVATISVQVKKGTLPAGCCFTASTTSFPEMKVVLLDFRDGKVPLDSKGMVQLSRRTICVEFCGNINVFIGHGHGGGSKIQPLEFSAKEFDVEDGTTVRIASVDIDDSCTIEVKVTWVDYWSWYKR